MDSPTLEKLIFSLDKIDVKELSGALNIGNNFGVDLSSTKGPKKEKKEEKKRRITIKIRVKKTRK